MRQGLSTLLDADPTLQIVGGAKNGAEAVEKASELKPDVIIMDLSMPVMDGVEATRRIREANPDTKVLILTTYGTSADIAHAIDAVLTSASNTDQSSKRDNGVEETFRLDRLRQFSGVNKCRAN